ncbi:hypothetical protein [Haloferula sp. A504]|jgi:hypothetical protein|uniref:hypothetical protein n=1 Tax=Haloferula sp. A504 TaxID=3373601 RepID=UPI0031C67213|nr:hypothetical protein [Verrucomicrobiaceae bacterium E54]
MKRVRTKILVLAFVSGLPAGAATPLPSLDAASWEAERVRIATQSAKGVEVAPIVEEQQADPNWRFGVHYFQGTSNELFEVISGDVSTLAQNGIRFTAARVLTRDLWSTPIDVLLHGGIMYHDEKGKQSNTFQYNLGLKFEWDEFPWSDHLRTRFGITSGISYANQIPITEQVNRGTPSSSHLLHFLDVSLAFNCADISRLTRIERLFPGNSASGIDNLWLTIGVPHRSGAWGTYGTDNTGQDIQGGSNYVSIGLEADF